MANVSLTIQNPFRIEEDILDGIASALDEIFLIAKPGILRGVKSLIGEALKESPEYRDLIDGKLRSELGVVNAAPALNAVIKNIQDGVKVTVLRTKKVGNNVDGRMTIEIFKSDNSEVIRVAESLGFYESENGHRINWLDWLTFKGDKILVNDYRTFYGGRAPNFSRTNSAIMIRGSGWRVPPEYAGTSEENWITRAILPTSEMIDSIIVGEIKKVV